MAEKKGWAAQMLAFFGKLPGQASSDFAKELTSLNYAEKCEFAVMLNAAGYPCDMPTPPKVG